MTAAVSDYRPEKPEPQKKKKGKGSEVITFVRTADILTRLGDRFAKGRRPFIVGFAAETEHLLENAREKLRRKK